MNGERAIHPGEILKDLLEELGGLSQHALAVMLGVKDPYVSALILGRKDIGPRMALKLEEVTGTRAEVWLHLQMLYTLHQLRTGESAAE